MKWIPADIETFTNSSEYVDTAVIPLLPVSFDEKIKDSAAMTEFSVLLTTQLERQLQGRILLTPSFSYLKTAQMTAVEQLKEWEAALMDKQFKHVFYITSDYDWKQHENQFEGTLLWFPTIPLQNLDEKSKLSVMEDQVRQLMNLFIQKWREDE